MIQVIKELITPLLSLTFLIMGSGLFSTFTSLRLEIEGFTHKEIGYCTSSLYTGILIGSLLLNPWIEKKGYVKALIWLALSLIILVIAQAIWIHPTYWSLIRFLAGICSAGVFIVIESWMLLRTKPELRSSALSIYSIIFYAALSGGQFLTHISPPDTTSSFYITAGLCAASILPLSFTKSPIPILNPIEDANVPTKPTPSCWFGVKRLLQLSPLGFLGSTLSGIILASVYGLLPYYGKQIGMSSHEVGNLMGVMILGGLSLQWPIGKLADIGNRRNVLAYSALASSFIALALAYLQPTSFFPLFALIGCFGGAIFTLYPLSMAYACEKAKDEDILPITGGFVFSYGIGAILGPILSPYAISLIGISGLFYFICSIGLILFIAAMRHVLKS